MMKDLNWKDSKKIGGLYEIVSAEVLDHINSHSEGFLTFAGVREDCEGIQHLAFVHQKTEKLYAVKVEAGS